MCSSPKRIPYFRCFNPCIIMPSKLLFNQFLNTALLFGPLASQRCKMCEGVQRFFTRSFFRRTRCPMVIDLPHFSLTPWNTEEYLMHYKIVNGLVDLSF